MLKGTWGIVDSKLDMGFHCVSPTEIGNAILHCIFHSPLEQLGGESLVCSPRSSVLAPRMHSWRVALLGLGLEWRQRPLYYLIASTVTSFLLAPALPSILGIQLSVLSPTIFLMCFLGRTKGRRFPRGQPSALQGRLDSRRLFPCHPNMSYLS